MLSKKEYLELLGLILQIISAFVIVMVMGIVVIFFIGTLLEVIFNNII